jgi:hypothetical protein
VNQSTIKIAKLEAEKALPDSSTAYGFITPEGFVWFGLGPEDGTGEGKCIILTPAGAEQLAEQLVQMAHTARRSKSH